MKLKWTWMAIVATLLLGACGAANKKQQNMENRTLVKLETNKGDILLALYNETPLHRENFIKLVKDGYYEGILFHRVIKDFVIQAGDPNSKTAADTTFLGDGDLEYTVPAEFVPELFHKRGALAAAREGDDVNPEKASSACHFYIVTGKKFTEAGLQELEKGRNDARQQVILDTLKRQHMKEIFLLRKAKDDNALSALMDTLEEKAYQMANAEGRFRYPDAHRKVYTTVGGVPRLDQNYTVFGEVVEGMDVVEIIEMAKTNKADRPLENIVITKATIVE